MKIIAKLSKNFAGLLSSTSRESQSNVSFSPFHFHMSTYACDQPLNSMSVTDLLVHKYNFSSKVVSRVATVLTRLKNPEKSDSLLSFLKESGFSITQMEKIVKYRPNVLCANLDIIKPKLKFFQELGLSSEDIAKIVSRNPTILLASLNDRIIPTLSVLNQLFGPNYDLRKYLKTSHWLMTSNLETKLVPNVEFLISWGIPVEHILAVAYNHHSFLFQKQEILRESMEKAEEMGVNRMSGMFVYAVRVIAATSKEKWELKLQAYRNLGFSDSDIRTMFKWYPYIIGHTVDRVKKIKEILLETGKFDLSDIVKRPCSLGFSITKRYEPRFRVLGILESKNLIKSWPTLWKIQTLRDYEFFEKFVSPYRHELGEAYFPITQSRRKETSTV